MAQSLISCPLCSAASFSNTSALCLSLVNVASKWLQCTICEEELKGLDKLTVHLLSHLIHSTDFKRSLTTESDWSSVINLLPNPQALNLVKDQNEQTNHSLIHKPTCDEMNTLHLQGGSRNERPSLKIDNEVMIFFNCDSSNENLKKINNENSVLGALDEEIPSSSGLPKFSINFDKTTSNQSENILCSKKKSLMSDGSFVEDNSRSDTLQYFFPITNSDHEQYRSSLNEDNLYNFKDKESHMDFCVNDTENEINSVLPVVGNKSDLKDESDISMEHSKSHIGNKSSYLSPKGERVLGFRCDICSLVFPDEHILSMHRQLIHIELHGGLSEPSSYKCHLCSKSFVMKGSLMVHMRVAHFGGAVVARLVEAKQLETNAVSPDSANFTCPICNKGFQKEQQLVQHEKLHEGKQCDICFKTFTTKYFLRKHKRLHTGEMPYQCSQCNKSFTFQQSYHKHLLYHSDDKPYSCADCGRAFKELSTLHNHQRIHTGEKPFSCETCELLTVSVF